MSIRWGEIGRLFRLTERGRLPRGGLHRRDHAAAPISRRIRPDFGAVKLIPRILQLMRGGDDSLLAGVAAIFEEHGHRRWSARSTSRPILRSAGGLC